MVTKTLPPVTRPMNMGHAVEQTGQSLPSRLFFGTLNTGKALVWDFPKWSFSNHPYVSGIVVTVGVVVTAYMYKGGIGMFKPAGTTPNKPNTPDPKKPETVLEVTQKAIVAAKVGLTKPLKSTELQPVIDTAKVDFQKAQTRHAELNNKFIGEAEAKTQGIPDQRKDLQDKIQKNENSKKDLQEKIKKDVSKADTFAGTIDDINTELTADKKALEALDLQALKADVIKLKREAIDLEEQMNLLEDVIAKLTEKHTKAAEAEKVKK